MVSNWMGNHSSVEVDAVVKNLRSGNIYSWGKKTFILNYYIKYFWLPGQFLVLTCTIFTDETKNIKKIELTLFLFLPVYNKFLVEIN